MVVAAPMSGVVEGLAADDDRAGRHHLGEELPIDAGRIEVWIVGRRITEPLVQSMPPVPSPLSGPSSGPAMNPSRDIDM